MTAAFPPPGAKRPASPPRQPRAQGEARLEARLVDGRSRLAGLRQQGCMKLLFPDHDGPGLTAMSVNTAGGVTGGDRLDLSATAAPGCRLTLTTQAAERLYAAQPGETGRISTRLEAGAGARIDWLPQETILFDRASIRRSLEIDLAAEAGFLGCETLVLGRPAMGETLRRASLVDRLRLSRAGVLLWQDALRLEGDLAALIARPGIGAGAGALATLVYVGPDAAARLAALRAGIDASATTGGASEPAPGLLLARLLAPDGWLLRQALVPILETLHGAALPRSWNL